MVPPLCSDYGIIDDSNITVVYPQSTIEHFQFQVNGIISCVTGFIGIFCNILCLIAFWEESKSSFQLYLLALAFGDIALLVGYLLMCSLPTIYFGKWIVNGTIYTYTYKYWYTLTNIAATETVWILCVMTLDRFLALCYPLKHKYILSIIPCKPRTIRSIGIFLTVIAAFLYGIPRFFELVVYLCTKDGDLKIIPFLTPTNLYDNKYYIVLYKVISGLVCCTLAPYLILLILIFNMYSTLRNARTWRNMSSCSIFVEREGNGDRKRNYGSLRNRFTLQTECANRNNVNNSPACTYRILKTSGQTNLALLLVVFKFLLSHLMMTAIDLVELVVGLKSDAASYAVDVSNYLVLLNSATNFWIYILCCKTFRSTLHEKTVGSIGTVISSFR